jgi:hypothetical protein
MCPFCLSTAAIVAGSVTSVGGFSALVTGTFWKRKAHAVSANETEAKEVEDGDSNDRGDGEESRFAR